MKSLPRIAVALSVLLFVVDPNYAQTIKNSDGTALAKIIGEDILNQNSRGVLQAARRINGEGAQQYEYLVNWVMPSGSFALLRMNGHFTTTAPIPQDGVVEPGGEIESPALELIRTAKRERKLKELFSRVHDFPTTDSQYQRHRIALLVMIEIAQGKIESANSRIVGFNDLVAKSNAPLTARWPELLLLDTTSRLPTLQQAAKNTMEALRSAEDFKADEVTEDSPVKRHLQAISARIEFQPSRALKNWHTSTAATSITRGTGFPSSRWHVSGGVRGDDADRNVTVRGVASHHNDYLHYQIPLTGDFQIEAELSTGAYQNGMIFVGGQWIQVPGSSGKRQGDYRSSHGYKFFKPSLPKLKDWVRYRTTVHGNQLTTFINGREIDQRQITYSPWVAIRNNANGRGTIRNIRITGQPTIPETVFPLLEGIGRWKPYWSEANDRWASNDASEIGVPENSAPENGLITGKREASAGFIRSSSLSHYHRPIVEDGVIEYEFYFKEGEYSAHPAIERLIFLLDANGVRLHSADDGIHDQSLKTNVLARRSKPVSAPIKLKDDDWNRVRLTFKGQQVQVAINGSETYTHKMLQRQRRFGLYYEASGSSLKVRNVTWTGDWPKELPPADQQELAGERPRCLADLENMQPFARIRFNRPFDPRRFNDPNSTGQVTRTKTGLHVKPIVRPEYSAYWLGDTQRVSGDFDATLRFNKLVGSAATGQASLTLRFVDETGNRYGTSLNFRPGNERTVGLDHMTLGKNNKKLYGAIVTGDETSNGSLRFIRREDTAYSLIAYGDSDDYHLIASRKLRNPNSSMTTRIEAFRSKTATIAAELEELVIRTVPPDQRKHDPRVKILERLAEHYAPSFVQDFRKPRISNSVSTVQANADDKGLTMRSSKTPASVTCQQAATGDFDITFAMGDVALNTGSRLAMKLDLDDQQTNLELAVQRGAEQELQVTARTQTENGEPGEVGRFEIDSIRTLRMTRIQRTVFFVCVGASKSRVFAFSDVGTSNVRPGSIQLVLTSESSPASAELTGLRILSANP